MNSNIKVETQPWRRIQNAAYILIEELERNQKYK